MLHFQLTFRLLALVVFETALILCAITAAARIRLEGYAWEILFQESGFGKMLLVAGVTQLCLYYGDLYNLRRVSDRRELFIRMAQALGAASLILALLYYWFPDLVLGRGIFAISTTFIVALVAGWRIAFDWISRRVGPRERLLLVGTNTAAVALARELFERRSELGVEIVGFVDPDPTKVGLPMINPGVVGTIDDIPAIVKNRNVDRVVVSLADARGKLPMEQLLAMKIEGVTFDHLASVYEDYTGKIAVENLRPSWFIFSSGFRHSRALMAVKRMLDVIFAITGLTVGAPVIGLVALVVRLTSEGPVFYHQRRVGLHGQLFTVHKFRTMRVDAEAETGPVWAAKKGDPRVTPVGALLRRTRLDEMPQLWNVVKGDMSFVGPRPERPEFVEELARTIPYYGQRHAVRPGVTGWAQVRYTYGASVEDALQKLQYDLFYIKNLSIPLDLYIIFQTVKTVILRAGA
jgi:sugar transferase (PEP-CTERM system associated)